MRSQVCMNTVVLFIGDLEMDSWMERGPTQMYDGNQSSNQECQWLVSFCFQDVKSEDVELIRSTELIVADASIFHSTYSDQSGRVC